MEFCFIKNTLFQDSNETEICNGVSGFNYIVFTHPDWKKMTNC